MLPSAPCLLQINVKRFGRKWTYNLTATGGSSSDELPVQLDATSLGVSGTAANKIVHGQLDRFLGGHTLQQR